MMFCTIWRMDTLESHIIISIPLLQPSLVECRGSPVCCVRNILLSSNSVLVVTRCCVVGVLREPKGVCNVK